MLVSQKLKEIIIDCLKELSILLLGAFNMRGLPYRWNLPGEQFPKIWSFLIDQKQEIMEFVI